LDCAPSVAGRVRGRALESIKLTDGTELESDQFVFACGPWLGKIFPDVLGGRIQPTKQQVFFLGLPAGSQRFDEENLPAWIDHGTRQFYGRASPVVLDAKEIMGDGWFDLPYFLG